MSNESESEGYDRTRSSQMSLPFSHSMKRDVAILITLWSGYRGRSYCCWSHRPYSSRAVVVAGTMTREAAGSRKQ